jgi:hypothetical protein
VFVSLHYYYVLFILIVSHMDVALYGAEKPCRTSINEHLKLKIQLRKVFHM